MFSPRFGSGYGGGHGFGAGTQYGTIHLPGRPTVAPHPATLPGTLAYQQVIAMIHYIHQ